MKPAHGARVDRRTDEDDARVLRIAVVDKGGRGPRGLESELSVAAAVVGDGGGSVTGCKST